MGILQGKRILVTGVLTDASIAFHVARLAQEEGATVILSSYGRVHRLTERIAGRLPQPAPVFNTAGMLGGFCTQFKNNTLDIEEKCGALDLNTCASTSCCTLIGGQKCVAGNENGPTNPANYTDYNLKNKDFYYYQGKCYGNCHK